MSFGLKNTGATFQSLTDKVFVDHLGKNMEVYMDDMVVKSDKNPHYDNLLEIFQVLRKYNIKLNPEKCSFGVLDDKFLELMIAHWGTEANTKKC